VKVLIIALDCDGISFALRCQLAGHRVRMWFPKETTAGDGLVTKVREWKPNMLWADLIFVTENAKLGNDLEPYFKKGFPILGANKQGAELELDRCKGQEAFERAGVATLEYEEFTSYDKAIQFVNREGKAFVAKPWGGTCDKALSYVPPVGYEVEAMVWKLGRWKQEKLKGSFILQECQRGTEMGVSGWFGPGGFSKCIEEDFEEKKLMVGSLGPNTGEQGTIVRHVTKSKLFDKVLKPLEEQLHEIGYVGNINVNCIVTDTGQPWPLELTMRPGWPDFDILQAVIQGDPCEWMVDLLEGRDTLSMDPRIAIGVVLTHGDYPRGDCLDEEAVGYPLYGITKDNEAYIFPSLVRMGKQGPETAGTYVMIVAALGNTVQECQKQVYKVCKEIKWPGDMMYRTDVGDRLKEQLPLLQENGFAAGMEFK
jgi:phosphoribosylamine--glycine ligase